MSASQNELEGIAESGREAADKAYTGTAAPQAPDLLVDDSSKAGEDDSKKRPAQSEASDSSEKRSKQGSSSATEKEVDESLVPTVTNDVPTKIQNREINSPTAHATRIPQPSAPPNAGPPTPQHYQPMLPFPPNMFAPQHGMMMNPYMNFPMPAEHMIFPGHGMFPYFYPPQPSVPPGIPLSLPSDTERLSEYQTFLRQQFEFFQAGPMDAQTSAQGRKRPVVVGQVGIRCRHCICLPLRSRGRGSVYFPSTLIGIYQAGQNMAGSHLATSCPRIPPPLKQELLNLRSRRDNASGGKQYWADGARALGVYEVPSGGLRWSNTGPPASNTGPNTAGGSPSAPHDDSTVPL